MNSLWTVTYGNYELAVDRKTRTYRLVETRTGTVWGDGLSLGCMDLKNRETGEVSRHGFGAMKVYSISEKAGPQGKRILFGLDCEGVPLDIYLICSEREIQMVVESSRDSATHTVEGFGLLPGLCSIPDDNQSYLVIPYREGVIVRARDVWSGILPIWDADEGVSMPFVGAVRNSGTGQTALALITDSAYGSFSLWRRLTGPAMVDTLFARDPERRRLDVRLVPLPGGDHISIARTYREKIISDRNHITLRSKLQDRPALERIIGKPVFSFFLSQSEFALSNVVGFLDRLREQGISEGLVLLPKLRDPLSQGVPVEFTEAIIGRGFSPIRHLDFNSLIDQITDESDDEMSPLFDVTGNLVYRHDQEVYLSASSRLLLTKSHLNLRKESFPPENREHIGVSLAIEPLHGNYSQSHLQSRWDDLESHSELFNFIQERAGFLGADNGVDWTAHFLHFWWSYLIPPGKKRHFSSRSTNRISWVAPLYATVYHDCIIAYPSVIIDSQQAISCLFHRCLLSLSPPLYEINRDMLKAENSVADYIVATASILCNLHRLTFTAFLTAHRFLTADYLVEETIYSDRTRVVINQSETEVYETDEFTLPPLGFYVRHSQMLAHDALRVGEETFSTRAWRVWRAADGKPLEQSIDISHQEFPDRPRREIP